MAWAPCHVPQAIPDVAGRIVLLGGHYHQGMADSIYVASTQHART